MVSDLGRADQNARPDTKTLYTSRTTNLWLDLVRGIRPRIGVRENLAIFDIHPTVG